MIPPAGVDESPPPRLPPTRACDILHERGARRAAVPAPPPHFRRALTSGGTSLAGAVLPGSAGDGDRDRAGSRHPQPLPSPQLADRQSERRPRQADARSSRACRCSTASHKRISIAFFLVAIDFIVFDLEAAFLYPWVAHPARGRLAAVLGGHGVHLPDPGRATPTSGSRAAWIFGPARERRALRRQPVSVHEPASMQPRGSPEARRRPFRGGAGRDRRAPPALPHHRGRAAAGAPHRAAGVGRLAAGRGHRGRRRRAGPAGGARSTASSPSTTSTTRTRWDGTASGCAPTSRASSAAPTRSWRPCTRSSASGEDEVTPDGRCSYVHFECLGSCDTAPMMMVDDDYHENLTPERVRRILKGLK